MPITGLVITLADGGASPVPPLDALVENRSLVLGERFGSCVAAVLDTRTEDENRRHWHWLTHMPGVAHVDIVYIGLDAECAVMNDEAVG